jgi:hypothetical protein
LETTTEVKFEVDTSEQMLYQLDTDGQILPPPELDGQSLRAELEGDEGTHRTEVYELAGEDRRSQQGRML